VKQAQTLFVAIALLAVPLTSAVAQDQSPAKTGFLGATGAPTPGNKTPTSAAAETSKTTPPGAMGTRAHPGLNNRAVETHSGTIDTTTGGGTGKGSGQSSGH
jgi:hypothetical protein